MHKDRGGLKEEETERGVQQVGVDGRVLPLSWTNPEIKTRGKKKNST